MTRELYHGELPDRRALAMERAYRNTVYCAQVIEQRGPALAGRYCGNRWCLVCNRVRTGIALNRYLPVLSVWPRSYFVTLTAPNVPGDRLSGELARYLADFLRIKDVMRRRGVRLLAVRKLECTYSATRDDYHPHFHTVVSGQDAAHLLHDEWLSRRPDASARAQDLRAADAGSIRELFKYFTKLVTKARAANGVRSVRVVDAAKLDTIFEAMRGRRVFQPVGFRLPKDDEDDEIGERGHTAAPDWMRDRLGEFPALGPSYRWMQDASDWVDDDGVALSGYTPTAGMRTLANPSPETER